MGLGFGFGFGLGIGLGLGPWLGFGFGLWLGLFGVYDGRGKSDGHARVTICTYHISHTDRLWVLVKGQLSP